MANSFTALLGLTKQVTGENPGGLWGSTLNAGFMDLVEEAIAGRSDVDVAAGSVTLTTFDGVANQARAMMLVITGFVGVPRNVIVPASQKLYLVVNETLAVVTIKTASGVGVSVAAGARVAVCVNQTLSEVFQVNTAADVYPPQSLFTSISGQIVNAVGFKASQSISIGIQGSLVHCRLPIEISAVTVNDTIYQWVRTESGLPSGDPFAPAPSINRDLLLHIIEKVGAVDTVFDCFARIPANGLSIDFFKCSGAPWITGSSRRVPATGAAGLTANPYAIYPSV